MSHTESNVNKNVECHYYVKSSHIARDCFRKENHESNHRYRKHNGNYVRKDTPDVNGLKNIRLFISENAMSVETDDESAWFIYLSGYAHMSYNREWYDEYHEKYDGTYIYLGDNMSHDVQG